MSKFYPFNSAAEVAKYSFRTEDELIKLSESESEYGKARFKAAIDCASGCKEFADAQKNGDTLPGYRMPSDIDISKTWHQLSRVEKGQSPTAGLKGLLK